MAGAFRCVGHLSFMSIELSAALQSATACAQAHTYTLKAEAQPIGKCHPTGDFPHQLIGITYCQFRNNPFEIAQKVPIFAL